MHRKLEMVKNSIILIYKENIAILKDDQNFLGKSVQKKFIM